MNLESSIVGDNESNVHNVPNQYVRRGLTTAFAGIMTVVQPLFTEETQVHGLENLAEDEMVSGNPLPGRVMLLPQHRSYNEFVNTPPLLPKFPQRNAMKVAARHKWLVLPLSGLLFHVHRMHLKQDASNAQKQKMKKHNAKMLYNVVHNFRKGIDAVIFPEGTTKSDGTILKIRSGAYTIARANYKLCGPTLHCVPVALTYDFMAGKPLFRIRRDLVYANFGKPFKYTPSETQGLSSKENLEIDRKEFNKRIRDAYLDLHTVTVSELGGWYVQTLLKQNHNPSEYKGISFEGLAYAIEIMVDHLSKIEGLDMDRVLGNGALAREKRIRRFYDILHKKGYVFRDNGVEDQIDHTRVFQEPKKGKNFKHENPLLYMINSLQEIVNEREAVNNAMKKATPFFPGLPPRDVTSIPVPFELPSTNFK
jgi:1-acyl-sn-glycerol-3-phosphate acyltransferase